MILSVNGVSLYYEKHGQGQPLIMVHGNGEDHTIFDQAVEKLRAHYTCYLIDSRDHGNSSKTNHLHYEDMAQDMLEFMERLQLEHVIFYGFSDGGIIGLLVAGKTDRIKALIISGANTDPSGIIWRVETDSGDSVSAPGCGSGRSICYDFPGNIAVRGAECISVWI